MVLWNTLDTKHPTSGSSMRASGIICLDLKTGSWIGGAVSCPYSLAIVIFVCQHQTHLRVTRQTRRMVQPGSLPPQSYLPVPLRHQREPATMSLLWVGLQLPQPSFYQGLILETLLVIYLSKKDGSPKAISTADVSLGATVTIPRGCWFIIPDGTIIYNHHKPSCLHICSDGSCYCINDPSLRLLMLSLQFSLMGMSSLTCHPLGL